MHIKFTHDDGFSDWIGCSALIREGEGLQQ